MHSGSPDEGNTNGSDRKRSKHLRMMKTFNVEINYAARIPLNSVAQALGGGEEHPQGALTVLDIILRQQQAKRSFHNIIYF